VIEIERKFLVANDLWRAAAQPGTLIRQGYLARTPFATIRIRCSQDHAWLTVKSPRRGLERDEMSYPIPLIEARDLLARFCGGRVLKKVRHEIDHQGLAWIIDVYQGPAEGLVIAEIELDRADVSFEFPPWLGAEVSHDPRYRNSAIALWKTARGGPQTVRSRIGDPLEAKPRQARAFVPRHVIASEVLRRQD
jgi:adenylate cyclase